MDKNNLKAKVTEITSLICAVCFLLVSFGGIMTFFGWLIYHQEQEAVKEAAQEDAKREAAGYWEHTTEGVKFHRVDARVLEIKTSDGRNLGLPGLIVGLWAGYPLTGIFAGKALSTSDSYQATIEYEIKGKKEKETLDNYDSKKIIKILKYSEQEKKSQIVKVYIIEMRRFSYWHQNNKR